MYIIPAPTQFNFNLNQLAEYIQSSHNNLKNNIEHSSESYKLF